MSNEYMSVNECLDIIGWTKPVLAGRLDVSQRVVLRWANGQNEAPIEVLEWLNALARVHDSMPLPVNWEVPRLAAG